MKKLLSSLLIIGCTYATSAQATVGWSFTNSSSSWGNTQTFTGSDGTQTTASMYHNTGPGTSGALVQGDVRNSSAGLQAHSNGESYNAPLHAIGNGAYTGGSYGSSSSYTQGNFETILFDFGENNEVSLNEICITYHKFDSDISIASYNGTNSNVNLAGQEYSDLLSDGWTNVAQLQNLDNYQIYDFNTEGYKSRYWLIGAYNPALDSRDRGWSTLSDFFKLEYIAGDIFDCTGSGQNGCSGTGFDDPVPVPSTIFLMGLGLIATRYFQKRKKIS